MQKNTRSEDHDFTGMCRNAHCHPSLADAIAVSTASPTVDGTKITGCSEPTAACTEATVCFIDIDSTCRIWIVIMRQWTHDKCCMNGGSLPIGRLGVPGVKG